jgi:hypothetical protein
MQAKVEPASRSYSLNNVLVFDKLLHFVRCVRTLNERLAHASFEIWMKWIHCPIENYLCKKPACEKSQIREKREQNNGEFLGE